MRTRTMFDPSLELKQDQRERPGRFVTALDTKAKKFANVGLVGLGSIDDGDAVA